MGLYFRKRIMKLPFGGRLTFGSGGFGLSFGGKNVKLHVNSRGSYVNTRIPKTNMYVGKKVGTAKTAPETSGKKKDGGCCSEQGCGCAFIAWLFLMFLNSVYNIASALWNGTRVDGIDAFIVSAVVIFVVYVEVKTKLKKRTVK